MLAGVSKFKSNQGIEFGRFTVNQQVQVLCVASVPKFISSKLKQTLSDKDFSQRMTTFSYNLIIRYLTHPHLLHSINVDDQRTNPLALPDGIMEFFNMDACRGAIKFGDKLANSQCLQIVNQLSNCRLPFQCAHGRPTVVPLVSLKKTNVTNTVFFLI